MAWAALSKPSNTHLIIICAAFWSREPEARTNYEHNAGREGMVLTQEEIDGCRDAFLAFDKDRSGNIDVWELRQVGCGRINRRCAGGAQRESAQYQFRRFLALPALCCLVLSSCHLYTRAHESAGMAC